MPLVFQSGNANFDAESAEPRRVGSLPRAHVDLKALGGKRPGPQILKGVVRGARAERGQQELGRGHSGVLAPITRRLVANDLVAARIYLKLHSTEISNFCLHSMTPNTKDAISIVR